MGYFLGSSNPTVSSQVSFPALPLCSPRGDQAPLLFTLYPLDLRRACRPRVRWDWNAGVGGPSTTGLFSGYKAPSRVAAPGLCISDSAPTCGQNPPRGTVALPPGPRVPAVWGTGVLPPLSSTQKRGGIFPTSSAQGQQLGAGLQCWGLRWSLVMSHRHRPWNAGTRLRWQRRLAWELGAGRGCVLLGGHPSPTDGGRVEHRRASHAPEASLSCGECPGPTWQAGLSLWRGLPWLAVTGILCQPEDGRACGQCTLRSQTWPSRRPPANLPGDTASACHGGSP